MGGICVVFITLNLIDIPDLVCNEPIVEGERIIWVVVNDLTIFKGNDKVVHLGKVGR